MPSYNLPNLFKTSAGDTVSSSSAWEKTRRPEILKLFEDNVYGQQPKQYDSLRYDITREDKTAMEGRAHLITGKAFCSYILNS